jgi:hypothetical protein
MQTFGEGTASFLLEDLIYGTKLGSFWNWLIGGSVPNRDLLVQFVDWNTISEPEGVLFRLQS